MHQFLSWILFGSTTCEIFSAEKFFLHRERWSFCCSKNSNAWIGNVEIKYSSKFRIIRESRKQYSRVKRAILLYQCASFNHCVPSVRVLRDRKDNDRNNCTNERQVRKENRCNPITNIVVLHNAIVFLVTRHRRSWPMIPWASPELFDCIACVNVKIGMLSLAQSYRVIERWEKR